MSRQLVDDEVQEINDLGSDKNKKSRAFIFVWNNPPANFDLLKRVEPKKQELTYITWCYEKGDSGTPHYQGYIYFKNASTLQRVKNIISSKCHVEIAGGSPQDNYDYIHRTGSHKNKDGLLGGPWEMGTIPSNQGKRNDLAKFDEEVKKVRKFKDLYEDVDNHAVLAKYPNHAKQLYTFYRNKKLPKIEFDTLYLWERRMLHLLKSEPQQRRIFWIWSEQSGTGKSSFGQYLMGTRDVLLAEGDYKDIIYAYEDQDIIWFDIPRGDSLDPKLMATLEKMSNLGYHMSTKYQSGNKAVVAHIICTSNRPPPIDLLPERFVCIEANKEVHGEAEAGTVGLSQERMPDLSILMGYENGYELDGPTIEGIPLLCDEYLAEYD